MRVCAIIATYNRAKYLSRSLDSVLAQTRAPDEVIVVDDGSDDGTGAILAGYGPRISVITTANGGKAAALNAAIPRTRAELIWVFDDDDVAFPDALARHVAAHEAAPNIGFTYSGARFLDTDANGHETEGPTVSVPDMSADGIFYNLQSGCKLNHPGTVVKRRVHDLVGLYDTTLQRAQDYAFLVRLSRVFDGAPLAGPTFHYRRHPDPRGGRFARHGADDRHRMFLVYDQRIWRALLPTLHEGELLPARHRARAGTTGGARQATIRRLMIAGRNGLAEWFPAAVWKSPLTADGPRRLNLAERQSAWLTFARPTAVTELASQHRVFDDLIATLHAGRCHDLMLYYALGLRAASRALAAEGSNAWAAKISRLATRMMVGGGWRRMPAYFRDRTRAA